MKLRIIQFWQRLLPFFFKVALSAQRVAGHALVCSGGSGMGLIRHARWLCCREKAVIYRLADGSVRFFVCGPVTACRQAGSDFHQVGLMNRSPYKIAN